MKKIVFIICIIVLLFMLSFHARIKGVWVKYCAQTLNSNLRSSFQKSPEKLIKFIKKGYGLSVFMDSSDNISDVESMRVIDGRYLFFCNEATSNIMKKDLLSGDLEIVITKSIGYHHPEDFIIIDEKRLFKRND